MAASRYAVEVTDGRVLQVWWALLWRGTLFGGIAGGLAGFVVGCFAGMAHRMDLVKPGATIAGYIVALPISFLVLRIALMKQYRGFALRVMPDDGGEAVAGGSVPGSTGATS